MPAVISATPCRAAGASEARRAGKDARAPHDAPMSNLNPIARIAPAVQTIHDAATGSILGGSVSVRLRSEDTDGQLGLVEQVVQGDYPGPRPTRAPGLRRDLLRHRGNPRVQDRRPHARGGAGYGGLRSPRHGAHVRQPESGAGAVAGARDPGRIRARYFDELVDLIARTNGLPTEDEVRDLRIAHGSLPV